MVNGMLVSEDGKEIFRIEGYPNNELIVYDNKVRIVDRITGGTLTLPYNSIATVCETFDLNKAIGYILFDDGKSIDGMKKLSELPNCFSYRTDNTIYAANARTVIDFIKEKVELANINKE